MTYEVRITVDGRDWALVKLSSPIDEAGARARFVLIWTAFRSMPEIAHHNVDFELLAWPTPHGARIDEHHLLHSTPMVGVENMEK